MKKIFALLLAAILVLSFAACGDKPGESDKVGGGNHEEETLITELPDDAGNTFVFESIDSETVRITGFSGPSAPHAVTIPAVLNEKAVTEIGPGAFRYTSNISALTLPATIEVIDDYAFSQTSITSINLPASLVRLGENVFAGCLALTTVTFDANATLASIPDTCFINCGLTSIEIPASVKTIGSGAFMSNVNLASVKLNEGTELVGNGAFQGCLAMASLTLPASLVEIGSYAFSGSEALYLSGVTCPVDSVAAAYIGQMGLDEAPPAVEE